MTWLYGPLMPADAREMASSSHHLYTSTCCRDRKPILKKKSASETILQHSLSQSTLLRRASAILKAQEAAATANWTVSDFSSATSSVATFSSQSSPCSSSKMVTTCSSSLHTHYAGIGSPCAERRHIHFNNEVVQCIAIDSKDGDGDDEESGTKACSDDGDDDDDDNDSDDGNNDGDDDHDDNEDSYGQHKAGSESRIIAPLPPTTLKCRSDTGVLSKTIHRPYDNDDDYDYDDYDFKDHNLWNAGSEGDQRRWLTSSGMIMPYDGEDQEEEEREQNKGMLGQMMDTVMDTVNTARDIAHVIWNVGWQS